MAKNIEKFRKNRTCWLDIWTKDVIGLTQNTPLTREAIELDQTEKLNRLFSYVRERSPFYRELYKDFPEDMVFTSVKDIQKLPLTTPADLVARESDMLCVSPKEISRIVTIPTSGTTGVPKHVSFTPEDQQLTVDHFRYGMQYLTDKEGKVLVLLPHDRPGSVGTLLAEAVRLLGAEATFDPVDTGITCMVGLPTFIAEMAVASKRQPRSDGRPGTRAEELKETMISVLLTAEYVSRENAEIISSTWDCMPFEHYGMTEMGLGGAVTCNMLDGFHIREHGLLFEIIDPETGEVLPDGQTGEVVFTTLNRKGMPFIRYRTGDIASILERPCRCGSVSRCLTRVGDRAMKKGRQEL